MRVSIAGRHLEMTDAMKSHVEGQLEKVRHHFDKVIDVDVVLSVEKHRHTAEVTVHANGVHIHGKETSTDMYVSIDTVVDKIDRQILKFKGRSQRYQPRDARVAVVAEEALEQPIEERAVDASQPGRRNIVAEPLTAKPMSVEEAAMQLELKNDTFLVFRNADTQDINVVYTKHDGTIGHILP